MFGYIAFIHCITLNLNIAASRKHVKIMLCNFCATNMMIIPAKFQPSAFKTVGGDKGEDKRTDMHFWHKP